MTLIMMLVAWDISGAHFNPVISLGMYIANKKWKEDLSNLMIMFTAQCAGVFFGVFLGWLSLIDGSWAQSFEDPTDPTVDVGAKVPEIWLGLLGPRTPDGNVDTGALQPDGSFVYTRNW